MFWNVSVLSFCFTCKLKVYVVTFFSLCMTFNNVQLHLIKQNLIEFNLLELN